MSERFDYSAERDDPFWDPYRMQPYPEEEAEDWYPRGGEDERPHPSNYRPAINLELTEDGRWEDRAA